jgi:3-deoxy-D-manno-octulosonic acid kinase
VRVRARPDLVEVVEPGGVAWLAADAAVVDPAALIAAVLGPLEPLAGAKGRGGVGVANFAGTEFVVRPCRRGGVFGALLRDRYASPHRVRRELEVTAELQRRGVPVARPVAAIARRAGAFWRLWFASERVVGAVPLPVFLAAEPKCRRRAVVAAALALRAAFTAGLRHPDLHPDNMLCRRTTDGVEVVLIDFDRASLGRASPGGADAKAQQAMLTRMQRYLLRHARGLAAVPTRAESMRFLAALGCDREQRHGLWRTVARRLAHVDPSQVRS